VHHDREEDPRPRRQPSLPNQSSLLLSGSFPLIDMNETFPSLGCLAEDVGDPREGDCRHLRLMMW
jgi:hypothetical protein